MSQHLSRQAAPGEFGDVLDRAPVAIWVTDSDGACVFLSRRWQELTGRDPRTGLGSGWLDSTHPDDRDATARAFASASARRAPFEVEYRLSSGDGGYRWVVDRGRPRAHPDGRFAGFVGAVLDVTDRKRAQDELAEREARFRALFSAIDEGYCLCEVVLDADGRPSDYRFLEANATFEAMTGLVDAVGRTAYELVPDLEPEWAETYAEVAFGGVPRRFEQGSEAMGRWFDVFVTPVGPPGRFALVFKDVTDRRRAEATLRDSEAAERQARVQAELLAELGAELETAEGFEARMRRLVEALVPRVADHASIEAPGAPLPVLAMVAPGGGSAATGEAPVEEWIRRAAAGEDQLVATPGEATHSQLAVPLELGAGVRGALRLALTDPERPPYREEDLSFVRKLADRASVLFAASRLREAEREIALELQRALLPLELLRHPGLEIAVRYEAGSDLLEVGGDWYDTFELAHGRVGFAVGDVVGHGLDAAAAMGRLRTALSALAPHAEGPGRLLSHLDAFAVGANSPGFATASCVFLDPATRELRYASAGHPPGLIATRDGATTWLEEGRSGPLFGSVDPDRPDAAITLEPGSMLVLYSDGLVERRQDAIGVGLAHLEEVVAAVHGAPVEEICDRVVAELGVRATRDDDVVILCVRLADVPG